MTAGRLLASGRDADIFEAGPGRVLRRSRKGRSQQAEAEVMSHVRAQGFPAPTVFDVSADGTELVMARVDGPTMLADLGRRPWRLRWHARTLAGLIASLGRVAAADGWPAAPVPGDRVVHLDLHPDNVILGPTGPVVIDWTNAKAGDPACDPALTWLLIACATIPGTGLRHRVEERFRGAFLRSFLRRIDRDAARRALPAVVEWKTRDPNMDADEVAAMHSMLDGGPAPRSA